MVFVLKLTGSTGVIRIGPLIRQYASSGNIPCRELESWAGFKPGVGEKNGRK